MKKIPTLFKREYVGHCITGITDEIIPGMEWVLEDEGLATIKWDGACCAIIEKELYKRYDAKKGKRLPAGAIPCCDPDPVTGHWPHWVKCDRDNPADKWFFAAYDRWSEYFYPNVGTATFEAVGKHFNGNPYRQNYDMLVRHGYDVIEVPRTFKGIHEYLATHFIEGIVFWRDGEPMCKIKRTDFGYEWPIKRKGVKWVI